MSAEERPAPADLAERAADEWPHRDAHAECRLVQHDRTGEPAAAANATISTSPAIIVPFAPMRLDTQPVTSIATAVTTR
jgi:hypothetical protein